MEDYGAKIIFYRMFFKYLTRFVMFITPIILVGFMGQSDEWFKMYLVLAVWFLWDMVI